MAVVKCKECGGQVSTEAEACPHCGAKRKNAGISLRMVLGIVVFGSIAYTIAGSDKGTVKPEPGPKVIAQQSVPDPEEVKRKAKEEVAFQKTVAFVKILKASMRDPDSFKISSVGANDDASVICIEYRAKNGFGGHSVERASYSNNKLSQKAVDFNKACAHKKDIRDMSHVEHAL